LLFHASHGREKKCIQNFNWKTRWEEREDNIIMDLKETEFENLDWIHLAQNRFQCWVPVNTIMILWIP